MNRGLQSPPQQDIEIVGLESKSGGRSVTRVDESYSCPKQVGYSFRCHVCSIESMFSISQFPFVRRHGCLELGFLAYFSTIPWREQPRVRF